jgi:BirA family biotin operon repressor/biotin-[acetyl-CoA-carboxylase] ligase
MAHNRLTPVARKLRREPTDVEATLWQCLRARQLQGAKFVRQYPIGGYVADFACRSARLVIELDGGQHAGRAADIDRTRVIEAHGFTLLRFWNNDVTQNLDGVLEAIRSALGTARNL